MALLAGLSPAAAQVTTGNISGTVQDAQGGVIPGATVVLISESRGTSLAPVTTNDAGVYVFPNVTADVYTVEVTMDNFKTVKRTGIRVSGGDRHAFDELYRLYRTRLERFLGNLVRHPQLVEEVLDDTLLVVWERAAGFKGESKLSTWIFAIAYRKAMKALRRYDAPIEDPLAARSWASDSVRPRTANLLVT